MAAPRAAYLSVRTSENMTYVTDGVAQFRSRWLRRKLAMISWRSARAGSRED
ncbi:hypothetical protein [Streptomyces sp. NPDC005538]|uniref:hypothetical protein n=1 Tax=unclassified Streptomyces TaxID=2593676 RepID=UPI0033AE617B